MSNCAQHPNYKGAMGYCTRCRITELEEECKKWKRLAEAPPCEAVQAGDRWYNKVIKWLEVDK